MYEVELKTELNFSHVFHLQITLYISHDLMLSQHNSLASSDAIKSQYPFDPR